MENYAFSEQMSVRDYECDLQGIVNSGVYQNYLEHVRHEYLKSIGIDFAGLARDVQVSYLPDTEGLRA